MDFLCRFNCISRNYDDDSTNAEGDVSSNIYERVMGDINNQNKESKNDGEKQQGLSENADLSRINIPKDHKNELILLFQKAKMDPCTLTVNSNRYNGKTLKALIRDYLMNLECPFTWAPDKDGAVCKDGEWIYDDNERDGSDFIEYLIMKEHEFRLVKKNVFRKLCVHLVLAYEKALQGKSTSAVKHIEQSQALVINILGDESELSMTIDRKTGIYHVLIATIAHIYYKQNLYKEALEAAKVHAENYSDLSQEAKAMVYGLHGGVLMEYGYRGNRLALVPIRQAIVLDPNCWLWRLFLGKILGRFRRMAEFNMPVDVEELYNIRHAAELQPEAQCLSHLADAYKQLNAYITHHGMPENIGKILSAEDIASLPKMAHDLYIKAATLEPNCPYNNARSAKGLLSLPVPFKDLDLAETYIVRALHLAPNDSMVNHYAGFYYETRREFDQALGSYRKALVISGGSLSGCGSGVGNFPAELGYLSLQHRLDLGDLEWPNNPIRGANIRSVRNPNIQGGGGMRCIAKHSPIFHLDAMLSKYKSKSHRIQILCNKGYYLLKFEKDILGALHAFVEAILTDPESTMLKCFWSIFTDNPLLRYTIPFNVYDIVKEEIQKEQEHLMNLNYSSSLENVLEVMQKAIVNLKL